MLRVRPGHNLCVSSFLGFVGISDKELKTAYDDHRCERQFGRDCRVCQEVERRYQVSKEMQKLINE